MAAGWTGEWGEAGGLAYLEVASGAAAHAPLVFGLHGRGSNAEDLAGLAPALDPHWRYLFPQAPLPFPGMLTGAFSWYEPIPASPGVMAHARERLARFLAATHARLGVGPGRSALFGFSQGAVMTLDTGLRASPRYAALAALSGYLAEGDELPGVLAAAREQPLLLVHGTADPVLAVGLAHRARQLLEAGGLTPEYHEFPMAHEINGATSAVLSAFLCRQLPPGPIAATAGR
jgi:phospholipase/carboxylesterase